METTLTTFSADQVIKGLSNNKKLVLIVYTKKYYSVRILCYNRVGMYPIVTLVKYDEGKETVVSFNSEGQSRYAGKLMIEETRFQQGDILSLTEGKELCLFDKYAGEDLKICANTIYNNTKILVKYSQVPANAFKLATLEERDLLVQLLNKEGFKWNEKTKELEDLNKKFVFGQAVLVKDHNANRWIAGIFIGYNSKLAKPYITTYGNTEQCLDYFTNKELLVE